MAGLCLAAVSAAGTAHAQETLSLYQKTGRALLVVRARAVSDSTRRPQLFVLETIKGNYPERTRITIVPYFEDKTRPSTTLKREVYKEGEESLLFLTPYVDDFGRPGEAGVYSVLGANTGKIDIPPEGSEAMLDAVRRFSAILAMGQMEAQGAALRALLREKNPWLIEAGLQEIRRFQLAEPSDLDALIALIENPRPDFRGGALDLVLQILRESGTDIAMEAGRLPAFQAVAARARMDDQPAVRARAVAALEAFNDTAALSLLESVGTSDPSQQVRYEALVAARRLRERIAPAEH
jgi:hypothetical protein